MTEHMQNMKNYLFTIDEVIKNGRYKDDWDSLVDHPVPSWYQKGKFGIFIHWGVYSVPAYGSEWYSRMMYQPNKEQRGKNMYNFHVENFGAHKDFGYRDFVPMFKAEKFDPKVWAKLFKETGAKFVMPVAEHHDGFQMYDSDLCDWNAVKMGPKRDILGELKAAVEDEDMVFTASSHRVEHYWFMSGGRYFESDMPPLGEEIPYGDIYWPSMPEPFADKRGGDNIGLHALDVEVDPLFMEDWLARTCEIVDKYRPKIVFFDWWIMINPMKPYMKKFAAYYYNRAAEWGEQVTINYKNDAMMLSSAVFDIERGQLSDIAPFFWQNDTSIYHNSWCHTNTSILKQAKDIICDFVDVMSKNGAMLLNIGPRADGTIPDDAQEVMREIGGWFEKNGEAIYDSKVWRTFGEGPVVVPEGSFKSGKAQNNRAEYTSEDIRYTYKTGCIYAFALKSPADGVFRMKLLSNTSKKFEASIATVSVLGYDQPCKYVQTPQHLTVITDPIKTDKPVCIKITYI